MGVKKILVMRCYPPRELQRHTRTSNIFDCKLRLLPVGLAAMRLNVGVDWPT